MKNAQRLRLRLFVEGVEIPLIAAQVTSTPNSPVMAALQVPPLAEATRFLPRSLVHLYFLDIYDEQHPSIWTTGASVVKNPGPSVLEQTKQAQPDDAIYENELTADAENQKYKLLFVGEIIGFQWTKSPLQRSVVLQCQDLSNYWDYAYQFANNDLFGPGLKAMFSGGSTNLFTDFLEEEGSAVVRILLTPSTRYPNLRGLLGGIVHLLEALGGSYYQGKKFAGQNIFFSLAELRLHITQMITAYDKDPTSRNLLGGGFDSLFGRSIGNLGEQASFRKVINMLSGIIFHESYGQPCPLYTPGTAGSVSGFATKRISRIEGFQPFIEGAQGTIDGLKQIIDHVANFKNVEKPEDPQERTKFLQDDVTSTLAQLGSAQNNCLELARRADQAKPQLASGNQVSVGTAVDQMSRYFKTANTFIGQAITKIKSRLNSSYKGNSSSGPLFADVLNSAIAELTNVVHLTVSVSNASDALPAQLKQQIFRPDVWFSAPPRCNVLFPDHYKQLVYQRSFLQEPTRLLLKTNDEFFGEDELFDNYYFAPKALTGSGVQAQLQGVLSGDILDHELFTGILPVFEKMGEFNIFAARSGMVDGQMSKVGLAQRSANFLYFKYRFASRQMQIAGRFNPYIACGFPGLVIDRYVDLETFKLQAQLTKSLAPNGKLTRTISELLGTHFVANFTEVVHQVDQKDGSTNINCSYARQVEESVEFLGAAPESIDVLKKQPGDNATKTTTVAAIFAPRLNSAGPNRGRIVKVEDVTDKYRSDYFPTAETLPIFPGKKDAKGQDTVTRVPVGFTQVAQDYGPEVVEIAGDPLFILAFKAYDITEEVTRTKRETIDVPPEEYIRPGWYGDCWHPAKISDVYYEFFATGAITEATQVQNSDGDASKGSFATADAEQILADAANSDDALSFARNQLLYLTQTQGASVTQAAAYLVLVYSAIRHGGFDTDQFIRSYTWRPIASLPDMFGSSDLQLDETGRFAISGVEGFHSRAFGEFEDLFGLTTPDIESVVGVHRGSTVSQRIDTRKRKRLAVLAYVAAISNSRAILG